MSGKAEEGVGLVRPSTDDNAARRRLDTVVLMTVGFARPAKPVKVPRSSES